MMKSGERYVRLCIYCNYETISEGCMTTEHVLVIPWALFVQVHINPFISLHTALICCSSSTVHCVRGSVMLPLYVCTTQEHIAAGNSEWFCTAFKGETSPSLRQRQNRIVQLNVKAWHWDQCCCCDQGSFTANLVCRVVLLPPSGHLEYRRHTSQHELIALRWSCKLGWAMGHHA